MKRPHSQTQTTNRLLEFVPLLVGQNVLGAMGTEWKSSATFFLDNIF